MSCFVIAEAGVNHNGSLDMGLRLIEAAAEAGADAVKFQTFTAEKLVRPGAAKAAYQRDASTGSDQHAMLKALELPQEAYRALWEKCRSHRLEFMSTPFDEESAEFLLRIGMRRIKIPSGELTNLPLLRHFASLGVPLIMSTGMADLDEVGEAVQAVAEAFERGRMNRSLGEMLTLLHCTSDYPAALDDVNLRAMRTLAEVFDLPIGYSDHTVGTAVATAAVALGAAVVEKHFTLDRKLPGPDHRASLEPDELARMIAAIRAVESAMGDGIKEPRAAELPTRTVVRRSVTLVNGVQAGQTIEAKDVTLLRPGDGIAPKYLDAVVGRRARVDLPPWTTLQWDQLTE